jgi:hypothetical protein
MSGFLEGMAARAQGAAVAGLPTVHLRRRARFEPAPDGTPSAATLLQELWSGGASTVDAAATDPVPRPADRHRPRRPPRPRPGTATAVAGSRSEAARKAATDPPPPAVAAPRPRAGQTPTPPDPPGADSAPTPDRPPVPAPDPIVIVRDRVVPVLVQAGVLDAAEEVEVVNAAAGAPAGVGADRGVQLRVDPPQPRHPRRDTSPPGRPPDVHVHIGRIEVVRAPAPPPSPPPAASAHRGAPAADHAAYLARRRERR